MRIIKVRCKNGNRRIKQVRLTALKSVRVAAGILPLFLQLLVLLTGQVTTDVSLEPRHDLGQPVITQLFHLTQDTSAEEHLNTTPSQDNVLGVPCA